MGGSSSKQKKSNSNTNVSKRRGEIPLGKINDSCSSKIKCEKGLICSDKKKDNYGNKTCQKGNGLNLTHLDYQDKYIKYKSKYLNLKEKNNSF